MGININWSSKTDETIKLAQEETKRHESDNKAEVHKSLINVLNKVVDGTIAILQILISASKDGKNDQ